MTYFFKDKSVLVTGGCSFIGSHLSERLVTLGADITIADDLSSGKLENIEPIRDKVAFINCDLRRSQDAQSVLTGKEIVFHLANIHGGRGYIDTHPGDIAQNFLIDGNVFFGSHLAGVERICYTSSACAYPVNLQTSDLSTQSRYLEEKMADPFTSGAALADGEYGWAKLMGEMALKAYHKQFGQKGVSCRLFTVYGPRENESHAIIAFIAKALLKQEPFEVWGTGQQDRNFTYVADIVDGLIRATECIDNCEPINLGTDEITKVATAAKLACKLAGHEPAEYFFDTSKPEGVHARAASTKNQKLLLGWSPSTDFETGLRETIAWYKSNRTLDEVRTAVQHRLFSR